MFVEEKLPSPPTQGESQRRMWLRLALGLLIGAVALWLALRETEWTAVGASIQGADGRLVTLAIFVFLATLLAKAWRWQILLRASTPHPPLVPVFKALLVGMLVNQILPVARLGDISRIAILSLPISRVRILSTVVVEKSLDLIALAISIFLILPFFVLPNTLNNPTVLITIGLALIGVLMLLAFQAERILRWFQFFSGRLPDRIERILNKLVGEGLAGLAALRSWSTSLALLGSTTLITLLSIAMPWVLLRAFGFEQLGWPDATVINAVGLIGNAAAATPAGMGVFEFLIKNSLLQLGVTSDSASLAYAILFHLIAVLPIVLIGSWALIVSDWRLHKLWKKQAT